MAIFLVTPLSNNLELIKAALNAQKSETREVDYFELQNGAGLLYADSGTTLEVSNKIGITQPEASVKPLGAALVTRVSSYYGIGSTIMWEWMKSRMEQS